MGRHGCIADDWKSLEQSSILWVPTIICPLDGMVDMPDLESGAAMCVSSSLTGGTKYILQ